MTLPTGEMATLANSGIFELLDMVYKTPHNINFSILCSHSYLALKHLDLAAKDQRNELDGSTDEFASNSVALLLFHKFYFLRSSQNARTLFRRQKRRMETAKDTATTTAPRLKLVQLVVDYKAFICGVRNFAASFSWISKSN